MAAALLRTRHLFSDDRALVAARAALHTEAAWFIPELNNWPDLRSFAGDKLPEGSSERAALTCGTTWCHGAPGVLLARAELARAEGNELDRLGHAALTTTLREVAKWKHGADVTPCHGVLGLLEIIEVVRDVLSDEMASNCSATVQRTRKKVIAAHARDLDWPTGVPSGKYTPSLMVGHAGVGHHFLRVLDPRKPSLLYPEHR
jgi:lantibiotic modifying enzyme